MSRNILKRSASSTPNGGALDFSSKKTKINFTIYRRIEDYSDSKYNTVEFEEQNNDDSESSEYDIPPSNNRSDDDGSLYSDDNDGFDGDDNSEDDNNGDGEDDYDDDDDDDDEENDGDDDDDSENSEDDNTSHQNLERFLSVSWIDIIYLAIKNSPKEYLSYEEIQTFARRWFPIYREKSYILEISTNIAFYNRYLIPCRTTNLRRLISYPIRWTINHLFIDRFEAKLWRKFTENELYIKSGMEHPEELFNLLNGYGQNYLGLNTSNRTLHH